MMDVGIFMANGRRLKAWLIVPPLLIVGVGLSSNAWRQRAHWQLQEARALSGVLPSFIETRKQVAEMIGGLQASSSGELGSEDRLISFLQDMAIKNDFMVESVSIAEQKNKRDNEKHPIPVLSAVVRGSGSLSAIQLYINQVKTEQRLLSVNAIRLESPSDSANGSYEAEITFDLILLGELETAKGGAR
jgi:hypothetical protein